ncbi:hypothetical protein N9N67_00135 [Bacteriovoracaceae bacterium]|nr:hypothetical protein [Bacteriovoracaceae bacterium]
MKKIFIISLMTLSTMTLACFKSQKQVNKMTPKHLVAKTIVCTKIILPLPGVVNGDIITEGIPQVSYNHDSPSKNFNEEKLGYTFPQSFGAEGVHYKNCALINSNPNYNVVRNYFDRNKTFSSYKNGKIAARQFKKLVKKGQCNFK